ncbi:MAG: Lrp/AsnC family transcriptional regulator [Verrucomicrobia bacterium]|jgi:DNA-binding Lrp family transcriptional regulator|nr:MAG: Lrp/AsnC family transcriptional regulator [Verrucomicrobiota bacterium]MDH4470371.1 Lrp/AsnC family transcriptional regulator [Verrucomicrobiae bacterium]
MDALLELLQKDDRTSPAELAAQLGLSEKEVVEKIRHWEANGTILAYQAVINRDSVDSDNVTAAIEVRITPEREGGFDRTASRIARFEEVENVYLMSGGYDLLVMVEGKSLRDVASFVAHKLSTIEAVQSCSTRFRLKTYKENGVFYQQEEVQERLSVAP